MIPIPRNNITVIYVGFQRQIEIAAAEALAEIGIMASDARGQLSYLCDQVDSAMRIARHVNDQVSAFRQLGFIPDELLAGPFALTIREI